MIGLYEFNQNWDLHLAHPNLNVGLIVNRQELLLATVAY
jgi:hypothetical protein